MGYEIQFKICLCCGKKHKLKEKLCNKCLIALNRIHKKLKEQKMIDYEKKENAIKDYEMSKKLLEKFEKNNGYK